MLPSPMERNLQLYGAYVILSGLRMCASLALVGLVGLAVAHRWAEDPAT